MNGKKLLREEIQDEIMRILSAGPSPNEIKKIRKLAMSKNIKLGFLRKTFCKKCFSYFDSKNSEVRIKKGMKIVKCKKCGQINRWKMKD